MNLSGLSLRHVAVLLCRLLEVNTIRLDGIYDRISRQYPIQDSEPLVLGGHSTYDRVNLDRGLCRVIRTRSAPWLSHYRSGGCLIIPPRLLHFVPENLTCGDAAIRLS